VQNGERADPAAVDVASREGDSPTLPAVDQQPRREPRGRLRVAAAVAIVLSLFATAGVVGYNQLGNDAGVRAAEPPSAAARSAPAPSRSIDPSRARSVAVQALLDRRAAAISDRDRESFLATVDPGAPRFVQSQRRMFDALASVPYDGWTYKLAGTSPFQLSATRQAELGIGAFAGKVTARYRIDGYDHTAARLDLYYTFRQHHNRWYIAADTDGDRAGYLTQRQLWDFGPVTVVRGERSIVLGLGSKASLERHASEADAAVPRVTRVWGTDWERKVVVLAPDSQARMAALLGAPAGKYAQIAAITRAESAMPADVGVADRIVINPAIWARLSSTGRRIVMTHEITHVATRTATNAWTPTWLSEGFADYVGYLGTDVAADVAARELLGDVRLDGAPKALPRDGDFDVESDDLAATYEKAWLACRLIANQQGQSKLVAFYREVGTFGGTRTANLGAAFDGVLSTTVKRFTAAWRDDLTDLAA
jgi:hypothetical protein